MYFGKKIILFALIISIMLNENFSFALSKSNALVSIKDLASPPNSFTTNLENKIPKSEKSFSIKSLENKISNIFNENSKNSTTTGICGQNLTYSVDRETGVLTISGTGEMFDYSGFESAPWKDYSEGINAIIIDEGITHIGDFAFEANQIQSLNLPASLNSIGQYAFYECKSLKEVTAFGDLNFIGGGAFAGCTNLETFNYKGTVAPRYETGFVDAVFVDCPKLKIINVPENYSGSDFCGMATTKKEKSSTGNWFKNNIGWIASTVTIIIAGFTIFFNWKKLKQCFPCCNKASDTLSATLDAQIIPNKNKNDATISTENNL